MKAQRNFTDEELQRVAALKAEQEVIAAELAAIDMRQQQLIALAAQFPAKLAALHIEFGLEVPRELQEAIKAQPEAVAAESRMN